MTPADVLLYLALLLLGMSIGAGLMTLLFGPDRDLDGPWDPRS